MERPSCPRCRTRLEYRMEAEIGDGSRRVIRYYYRCPRCGYRIYDSVIVVKKNGSKTILELTEPIYAVARRIAIH